MYIYPQLLAALVRRVSVPAIVTRQSTFLECLLPASPQAPFETHLRDSVLIEWLLIATGIHHCLIPLKMMRFQLIDAYPLLCLYMLVRCLAPGKLSHISPKSHLPYFVWGRQCQSLHSRQGLSRTILPLYHATYCIHFCLVCHSTLDPRLL